MSHPFPWKTKAPRRQALPLSLALALCLALAPTTALGEETTGTDLATHAASEQASDSIEAQSAGTDEHALVAQVTHDMIDKKGYLDLSLAPEQIESRFSYGDLLSVTLNGQTIEAPLVNDRTFVDQLQPAVVVRQKSDGSRVVELGADNDKLAATFGIAEKGDAGWTFAAGVAEPLNVTISLAKQGGYYDRYVVKQLRYTDKRSDYAHLSDEQFANFREIKTTGIAPGVLYRSATPVNPQRGRNTYADACIKKAGVTYAVNLSDAEEKLAKYRGYEQSYYATIDHIALHASIHLDSEEYRSDLMRGFRAMAQHPGVYLIHCLEGKDRTGIAVALLEFLMGASYDEVIADHMVSFDNYFGITEADPRYESVVHGNLTAFLEKYFGVDTLKGRSDLQQKAEQYMLAGGLTPDEIAALKHNLNPNADKQDEGVNKKTDKQDQAANKETDNAGGQTDPQAKGGSDKQSDDKETSSSDGGSATKDTNTSGRQTTSNSQALSDTRGTSTSSPSSSRLTSSSSSSSRQNVGSTKSPTQGSSASTSATQSSNATKSDKSRNDSDSDRTASRSTGSSSSSSEREKELDAYKRGLPKTSDVFNPHTALVVGTVGAILTAVGFFFAGNKRFM